MESKYSSDPQLIVEPTRYEGGVPVFEPRMDQFADFYKFNKAINQYGMQSGIVKVIPPKEWIKTTNSSYNHKNLEKIRIKNPIIQHINQCSSGVFSQQNVERARSYNIFQWKDLSQKLNHQPPAAKGQTKKDKSPPSRSLRKGHKRSTSNPDYNLDTTEFTTERCEQLEKMYWKSLTYAEPMYGADSMGSLFSDRVKSWNVAHLPNLLDLMDVRLPGVNDAYLYAGLWKATFAWHLEDQDLYSINYLHFGAPKQWYSIPQDECDRFFNLMKDTFNEEYANCHEFLRHKTFLVSPQYLDKHGIRYNKIVHHEKEFIITYPFGYHAGFNYGYNLAESVNFALDDWFPYGNKTKKCECILDSVGINVKQLYCRFKGIPYDIPDLVNDDGNDNYEEEQFKLEPEESVERPPQKKRSRSTEVDKNRKTKQAKKLVVAATDGRSKQVKKLASPNTESKSLTQSTEQYECYLCPNNLPKKLLKRYQYELLPTDFKNYYVHRLCSLTFPNELKNDDGTVIGLKDISKAQKNLKCLKCEKKVNGACLQCSYGKCCRAYHATCAIMDGMTFDFSANGFICKHHFPKYTKGNKVSLTDLSTGSLVQWRHDKDYGCGYVNYNSPHKQLITVSIYPEMKETVQIKYSDVLNLEGFSRLDQYFIADVKKKPREDKVKKEAVVVLDDYLVTGLNDNNLALTQDENFVTETVNQNFSGPKFKEIWYNLPSFSNDQIDRYTDDIKIDYPNDPYFMKQMRRKKRVKSPSESVMGPKTLPSVGTYSMQSTALPAPLPSYAESTFVPIRPATYQLGQPHGMPHSSPAVVTSQNQNPNLPQLYNFIHKPGTPV